MIKPMKGAMKMSKSQMGCQTIGCRVLSCRHNEDGAYCALSRVEIEPCCSGKNTGKPEDESLCGNYRQK